MLTWPWTAMCHVWRKLPVNVHILLFVGLPPQPFTLEIWVWVGLVKSADSDTNEFKVFIGCCFISQMIHHFPIISTWVVLAVSLYLFRFFTRACTASPFESRTSWRRHKSHRARIWGSKVEKTSFICRVCGWMLLCMLNTHSGVPSVGSPWPSCCSPWTLQSSEHWKRRFSGKMRCSPQTAPWQAAELESSFLRMTIAL